MAKKIIVPEEELHDIADAINNRADYLDDIDEDDHNRNSLIETENRQMESKNMAANILSLSVNLNRYYTKQEINDIISNDTARIVYVLGDLNEVSQEERDERTLYLKKYDTDRYAIWLWKDNKWQLAGGNVTQDDLDNNYYTKAYIDECCNSKQDVLVPGDNITINENNVISASFDGKFKLKASIEPSSGDITQGTLQKYDNPNNDPVFAILGNAPIYITLDQDNKGYVVVNLNPDKLEGSANIPLTDESTKVATTEFVSQKIEEAISGLSGDVVTYIVFDTSEEESRVEKETGKIYFNQETNEIHFGNTLLNGLIWNVIYGEYDYSSIYVEYSSGFPELDTSIVEEFIRPNYTLPRYLDIFSDPWQGTQSFNWQATNVLDSSKTLVVTPDMLLSDIVRELNLEDIPEQDTPVIYCTPLPYPLPTDVPNHGFSAGNGIFATNISGTDIWIQDDSYVPEDTISSLGDTINYPSSLVSFKPGFRFEGWCTSADGYIDEESTPQELGFEIDPEHIGWSWSGTLYAIFTELIYSDVIQEFINYDNIVFKNRISGSTPGLTLSYSFDEEEPLTRYFRYVLIPVASFASNVWTISSEFSELSNLVDVTRDSIINDVYSIASDIIEDSDYISFTDTTTISIPSDTIFFVYVQEYEGTDEDIRILNTDYEIFKSWASNDTLTWEMQLDKSDSEGSDE